VSLCRETFTPLLRRLVGKRNFKTKESLMSVRLYAAIAIAASLTACASAPGNPAGSSHSAHANGYSFGLWGDMPYARNGDYAKLPALIDSLNASDIAFSIYDGDFKDGSSQCTDESFSIALKMFGSMKKPLVYVPGDNEWTDCHRTNNGGYDTLERLAYLRKVMFPTLNSLGQTTMPLEHQGKLGEKYVENTRFTMGPVMFVGLNVPGSNNNVVMTASECTTKSARKAAQCDAANAEYLERDAANIAWLEESFAKARASKVEGVVVVVQADPGFDLAETYAEDESLQAQYSGYRNFMAAVVKQTEQFSGQVLFVHGDTHSFKIDKPLYSPEKMLPNFTRLETFGSPHIHWVKVRVEPGTPHLFHLQPMIVRQP
jgi:hypothetical protein